MLMKSGLNTFWRWLSKMLLGVTAIVFVTSCDDDDDNGVQPVPVAYVSLYNASPEITALDILVDNTQINIYPFEYTEYTGYQRFYTGDRNFKITPVNANNTLADTTVTFEDGQAYSVFIVDETNGVDILVLEDNAPNPSENNAMLRVVHLSPDAPEVNLFTEGASDPLFSGLTFKEATDFTEVSADEYDFEVRSGGDALLTIPDINLRSGWFYTIIVRGFATPPSGNDNVLSAEIIVN